MLAYGRILEWIFLEFWIDSGIYAVSKLTENILLMPEFSYLVTYFCWVNLHSLTGHYKKVLNVVDTRSVYFQAGLLIFHGNMPWR